MASQSVELCEVSSCFSCVGEPGEEESRCLTTLGFGLLFLQSVLGEETRKLRPHHCTTRRNAAPAALRSPRSAPRSGAASDRPAGAMGALGLKSWRPGELALLIVSTILQVLVVEDGLRKPKLFALLSVATMVLQMTVEGPRWQMILLYAATGTPVYAPGSTCASLHPPRIRLRPAGAAEHLCCITLCADLSCVSRHALPARPLQRPRPP